MFLLQELDRYELAQANVRRLEFTVAELRQQKEKLQGEHRLLQKDSEALAALGATINDNLLKAELDLFTAREEAKTFRKTIRKLRVHKILLISAISSYIALKLFVI